MRKAPGLTLQAAIVQDNVPVEVCGGLFLGSIHSSFNIDTLKEKKITHVLNLAGNYATFPETFTYLSVSVRDKEYSNLLSCLPAALIFIDGAIGVGGVLVHCSGGRSRSPAVVIAYLMAKKKLSFEAAYASVRALRPVVSLNAGFEEQLKCLDQSNGDVFLANQLLLKSKMQCLARQLKSGEPLTCSSRKKQSHKSSSRSLRSTPMLSERSLLECDTKDMLCDKVPNGFCLSLPPTSLDEAQPVIPDFIPALRSMGTLFGCAECGARLFSAGSILKHGNHDTMEKQHTGSSEDPTFGLDNDGSCSSSPVAADPVQCAADAEASKKKPLLSKLRLRPHSPSILRSMTIASPAAKRANEKHNHNAKAKSGASSDCRPGLLDTVKVYRSTQQSKYEKENTNSRFTSGEDLAPVKAASTSHIVANQRATGKNAETLWRSIASLKAAKLNFKGAIDKRNTQLDSPSSSDSGSAEREQMDSTTSFYCEEFNLQTEEASSLEENARLWEQGVMRILRSTVKGCESAEDGVAREFAEVLKCDAKALVAVAASRGCSAWFIEPQTWFIEQVSATSSGVLCCPNETCGSAVGEWHWDGVR